MFDNGWCVSGLCSLFSLVSLNEIVLYIIADYN